MEFDLRNIRALLDLTSEELANDLGVSRQTISNWENGEHPVSGYVYTYEYVD